MSVVDNTSSFEPVILHTVPCDFLPYGQADTPYQSVRKLTLADGMELSRSSTIFAFNEDEMGEIELSLTPELSQKLASFFDTYFVSTRQAYNCHLFALWMSGIDIPDGSVNDDFTELVEPMMNDSSLCEGFLRLGQMGVMGHKMGGSPRALHSVIGLGESNSRCLQVMGIGGDLAVDSYDNVRKLCTPSNGLPYPGFGMYTQPND